MLPIPRSHAVATNSTNTQSTGRTKNLSHFWLTVKMVNNQKLYMDVNEIFQMVGSFRYHGSIVVTFELKNFLQLFNYIFIVSVNVSFIDIPRGLPA